MQNYESKIVDLFWRLMSQIYYPQQIVALGALPEWFSSVVEECVESTIVLMDGQESVKESILRTSDRLDRFSFLSDIVSSDGTPRPYYALSLRAESGLIAPENLSGLWQNIQSVDEHEVETTRIEEALSHNGLHASWAIFNRLDCIELLQNIQNWAACPQLIVCRVAEEDFSDKSDTIATARAVREILSPLHFEQIIDFPGGHTCVRQVVYVRNCAKIESESIEIREENSRLSAAAQEALSQVEDTTQMAKVVEQKDEEVKSLQKSLDETEETAQKLHSKLSVTTNNLKNLRTKHRTLTKTVDEQYKAFEQIKARLLSLETLARDQIPSQEQSA